MRRPLAVPSPPPPLLALERLTLSLPAAGGGWIDVVRGVDLTLARGEAVGLVGESGSGKTLTALSVLRLQPPAARLGGRVLFDGADLLALPERELRRVRGGRIGIAFQEAATALDPFYTIGFQIAEAVSAHRSLPRRQALAEAERLLARMAVTGGRRGLGSYPHQLSGGQRQRVMLAIALAAGPEVLLADEPTSAVDATVQAQVLELLAGLRAELGLAVLLITHDLAVVGETCDRGAVLYAGKVVEEAPVAQLFGAPAHPYTQGLLAALPRLGAARGAGEAGPGPERLPAIAGQPPSPAERPPGCAFHPRCPRAMPICRREEPRLAPLAAADRTQRVACWLYPPDGGGPERGTPDGEASHGGAPA